MNKKVVLGFMTVCLLIFFSQKAFAGADWQADQKEMFGQLPVRPGDFIDKSNWEKVKDILPDQIVSWVKKGEWVVNVSEFEYDFDYTPEYYKLSAKNAGKYGLGAKKQIIDQKTGKAPLFISGLPFPNVDVKNDPDGATKLMHNNNLCLQMNGSYDNVGDPKAGCLQWIGPDGHERGVGFEMKRFYYWNRPEGEWPNPNEYMHTTSLLSTWPYDLTGTATLYIRYLDGREDNLYAYIPTIRRVKRLSGANRSDPQMGSDQCMDDSDGFSGHVESMRWIYIGEKVMLCPKWEGDLRAPRVLKKNQFGAWECYLQDGQRSGWEESGWTGAPWAFTNNAWVPREMWIIKAEPLNPFYAYGTLELYIDKKTRLTVFNTKYNQAGEYWKMLINEHHMTCIPDPAYAPSANAFNLNGAMVVVDEKTRHASTTPMDEIHTMALSPRVQPRHHTAQAMKTWTK